MGRILLNKTRKEAIFIVDEESNNDFLHTICLKKYYNFISEWRFIDEILVYEYEQIQNDTLFGYNELNFFIYNKEAHLLN